MSLSHAGSTDKRSESGFGDTPREVTDARVDGTVVTSESEATSTVTRAEDGTADADPYPGRGEGKKGTPRPTRRSRTQPNASGPLATR
ncbi:hypothetical protein BRC77_03530 [Halobacteriales archaeon QH_8_64_26]|nr:MAG: hypothetical protein BRC77_03530 [Halobacteriales archaeon QH_8_64_26]